MLTIIEAVICAVALLAVLYRFWEELGK